ncbi:MAG: ROK family protein [Bacteroidales bacterium]
MNIIDHTLNLYKENKSAASYKKLLLKMQIIELFYKDGQKAISDLCEVTNNSIPTLTAVLNELAESGWIKNYGVGESKGGRRPTMYGLNSDAGYIVGIELSRDFTRMCVFNLANECLHIPVEISEGLDTIKDILPLLKYETAKLLEQTGILNEQVMGYGITIPGLIDIRQGISYSYPQLGSDNLNTIFSNLLERPSFVEHDTKSMVLGEAWFGQAKKMANVLFLNIGSCIGMGIIINGKLYHGHSGFSGEFGHIQMIPKGELCYCGRIGCLETVASGNALVKKAITQIKQGKHSLLTKIVNGNYEEIKLSTIIKAMQHGDQFSLELLEEAGDYIARGISTLLHLFNPEAIIIGGDMAEAGDLLLNILQQKLNKYVMVQIKKDSKLILSDLHQTAGLLGAIPVVMSNRFLNYQEML